jgi:hypothetical protein
MRIQYVSDLHLEFYVPEWESLVKRELCVCVR